MKNIYAVLVKTSPPILIPLELEPGKEMPEIREWMGEPYIIGIAANSGDSMRIRLADIAFHQLTDEETLRRRPIVVPGTGRMQ